jgi:DNA modification methylase
MTHRILLGDCLETLKTLPDCSVQTCVTSPPYYGLRDYGTASWEGGDEGCEHTVGSGDNDNLKIYVTRPERDGEKRKYCQLCGAIRIDSQIGLEQSPEEYINKLVAVFREVRRVLKDDGTLWLNLGDSYASAWASGRRNIIGNGSRDNRIDRCTGTNFKEKDLMMIPARVALALQADGWWLRSEIIWHKPNPMPESVTDRPTKSHEMIYLLAKSQHYFYDADAIKEPYTETIDRWGGDNKRKSIREKHDNGEMANSNSLARPRDMRPDKNGRNKRDVWTVTTKPYKEAHFATFPPDLIEPCILAGSRMGDTVLDPFNGSGTTGAVSLKHHRDYMGCELNPDYIKLTEKRLSEVQPTLGDTWK